MERRVPELRWSLAVIMMLAVSLAGVGAWELSWRRAGVEAAYRNSAGLWAMTRRQLDRQPTNATAIVGSSRLLFDINLDAWERETGQAPVQLSLEGTSSRPFLDHIANESDFSGLLVVGVTPGLFFSPIVGLRTDAIERYRDESPSQWMSQRLSMLVEPRLAFYDPDFALFTVLRRQPLLPERLDPPPIPSVRKISNTRRNRQNDMWERVATDPAYNQVVTGTWKAIITAPREMPPPEVRQKMLEEAIEEVRSNVETIRARGGEVVFVRAPSSGPFRDVERKGLPRERFWDAMLDRADAIGVHFEDHPELQGLEIPEWSHLRATETDAFTTNLIEILRREMLARGSMRQEIAP